MSSKRPRPQEQPSRQGAHFRPRVVTPTEITVKKDYGKRTDQVKTAVPALYEAYQRGYQAYMNTEGSARVSDNPYTVGEHPSRFAYWHLGYSAAQNGLIPEVPSVQTLLEELRDYGNSASAA